MALLQLPNGKQQYLDANGDPLGGGSVYFYIPTTTNFKDTWQDPAGASLNTNPVQLDAAGEAVIWGNGEYRQVVKDVLGNTIWDENVQVFAQAGFLPSDLTGAAGDYIRVNAGATAYENISAQVARDDMNNLILMDIPGTYTPGNATAIFGRKLVAVANNPTTPEVGSYIELNQTVAPTGAPGTVYKIAYGALLKSTVSASAASVTLLGGNFVVTGYGGPSNGALTSFTADINNLGASADVLSATGAADGITAVGGGSARATAGFHSQGPLTSGMFNYGFAVDGNVNKAGFTEQSNAPVGFDLEGSHTYGMSMLNATSIAYTIVLPNNVPQGQANSSGLVLPTLMLDASNKLQLGYPLMGYIQSNQSILPGVDNVYQMGGPSNRWTTVWAVNGSIQTSDPSLKTQMQGLPDVWPLVEAINPITFKWKSGGQEVYEEEEDGLVHATVEKEFHRVEERDGKYVLVKKLESHPVFDPVPVHDEDGAPIVVVKPEIKDDAGNVLQERQELPKLHFVPRMVPGKVKVQKARDVLGKRTHWGFNAEEVASAFAAQGLDFGGYVEAEDGTKGLRPDQLLSVLWKAVKDMKQVLDEQAEEIAQLKAKMP